MIIPNISREELSDQENIFIFMTMRVTNTLMEFLICGAMFGDSVRIELPML
jgi:hypothetical protein